MTHYFVVIELPGGEELKFNDRMGSPENFWDTATKAINNGEAKIISQRKDTGVSEELRLHLNTVNKFTTYVLAGMDIDMTLKDGSNEAYIFKNIVNWLSCRCSDFVIDAASNFQLVSMNC